MIGGPLAKRMTDTGKWAKAWFRALTPIEKCVWIFLCDLCDHAGIWDIDEDALSFYIGDKFTVDQILKTFGERVEIFGDKMVLKGFLEFQYGALNQSNRVHKSAAERLEKLTKRNVLYTKEGPSKPLPSPMLGAQDKDKDRDKDNSCINTATHSETKPMSEKEIYLSLPIFIRERIQHLYEEKFIEDGVMECVLYHLSKPHSLKWNSSMWGQKISSWLAEKKRRSESHKTQSKGK